MCLLLLIYYKQDFSGSTIRNMLTQIYCLWPLQKKTDSSYDKITPADRKKLVMLITNLMYNPIALSTKSPRQPVLFTQVLFIYKQYHHLFFHLFLLYTWSSPQGLFTIHQITQAGLPRCLLFFFFCSCSAGPIGPVNQSCRS